MVTEIYQNERVNDCLFNLFCRWMDERGYEDINLYKMPFKNVLKKEFPTAKLKGITEQPFGFKIEYEGHQVHLYATEDNEGYVSINAKISK